MLPKRTLLEVTDLTKTYASPTNEINYLEILNKLTLTVNCNETISIVGKSGVGKSSLLHILARLDDFNSGDIIFDNRSILSYSDNEIANWRNKEIGFVYQFHFLIQELSIIENIALPAMLSGLSKSEVYDKAFDLLKRIGLENRSSHKPNQISGGERQRVAIARALINQPRLILADEPTGNLDEYTSLQIQNLLLEVVDENQSTLMIVTHDRQFSKKLQTQYMLTNGKLELINE